MTKIRDLNLVSGTVFDLPHVMSLPADDCNVLLVSSRTLFFVQKFGIGEVGFRARYAAQFLEGNRMILAQSSSELDDINDLVNLYELEAQPVTTGLIEALNGIAAAISTSGASACDCATVGEALETTPGIPGGTPPDGFGEPDPAVTDRLCKAANAIHDSIIAAIDALIASPAEEFAVLGFGLVSGLVSSLVVAAFLPVVGILLVGVAGAVVAITIALLASGIDLPTLKTQLVANRDDAVCALVTSSGATHAREQYITVLADGGVSLVNQALVYAMLTNNVLDLLWFSTPDSEAFLATFVPTSDCLGCGTGCNFFVSVENPGGVDGTVEYLGGGLFELTSGTRSDGDEGVGVIFWVNDAETDDCGPMLQAQFSSGPTTGYNGSLGVRVWIDGPSGFEDRVLDYNGSIVWSGFRNARQIYFNRADGPFTLQIVTIPL